MIFRKFLFTVWTFIAHDTLPLTDGLHDISFSLSFIERINHRVSMVISVIDSLEAPVDKLQKLRQYLPQWFRMLLLNLWSQHTIEIKIFLHT